MTRDTNNQHANATIRPEVTSPVVCAYEPPRLTVIGKITDLTHANSPGPKADGNTRRKL